MSYRIRIECEPILTLSFDLHRSNKKKQFRLPSLLVLCRRYICSTTTAQKTKRGQVFV